jgi:hypothetical protein
VSQAFDSQVPKRVLKDVISEQPNRGKWSEDLSILLDPNIVARPLSIPSVGAIKIKNQDFKYHWVRLKMGPNADTSRYMQLKALGFQNATPEDVDVVNADIIEGKTEIRSGDRILMKAPPDIYNGLKKQYMLDAINQTSRAARGQYQEVNPGLRMSQQENVMRTGDYAQTSQVPDIDIARMMAKSSPANTSVVETTRRGGK